MGGGNPTLAYEENWLDKVDPYVDAINFATAKIGQVADGTILGIPLGSAIETAGDIPNVIFDLGQLGQNLYRKYIKHYDVDLRRDIADNISNLIDVYDPTGLAKDIYLATKYLPIFNRIKKKEK